MRYRIKDLPEGERPRERLLAKGPSALSDAELLALIIRTGSRKRNAVDLAREVLKEVDLRDPSSVTLNRLKSIDGLGDVKAGQLLATLELSKRIGSGRDRGAKLTSPEDVFEEVVDGFDAGKECFLGLYLDTKSRVLKRERVSVGSLNRSVVHPREVLRPAVLEGAASLIVAHNHPSGDPEPSEGDIEVTRRLVEASGVLGIELLDHVVVGDGAYVSLAERGVVEDLG